MRELDISLALYVMFEMPILLAAMGFDQEPMWKITDKNKAELEACLKQPFQTFGGEELYKTPAEKAAILFYSIIKGHKLENGNKRTGVIMLLTFLSVNGYWLRMTSQEMYELALSVAKSSDSEKTLEELRLTFEAKMNATTLLGRLKTLFDWASKQ